MDSYFQVVIDGKPRRGHLELEEAERIAADASDKAGLVEIVRWSAVVVTTLEKGETDAP